MSSQPVPGWYADPEYPGYRRWWDGETWADTREPLATPTAPATPPLPVSAPYGTRPGGAGVVSRLHERFDPDPSSPDSISKAIETVKAAFWRILGLGAIGLAGQFLLFLIGQVLLAAAANDVVSSSGLRVDFNGDDFNLSAGPSFADILGAVIVAALFFGGAALLGLWIFAAIVRVVRGQQAGMRVGVGEALTDTWPRAWRLIVLGISGFLILALLTGISAAIINETLSLGLLFGLIVLIVSIGFYTALVGLYAWLVSPTSAETTDTPRTGR